MAQVTDEKTTRSTFWGTAILAGAVLLIGGYVALIVLVFFQPEISLWAGTLMLVPAILVGVAGRLGGQSAREKLAVGCLISLVLVLGGLLLMGLAWLFQREAFQVFFETLFDTLG